MSHMVIYRSSDGKPGFQQADDLSAAVAFVERMRNAEGVESARIYRLEQVNFSFQPYYQVHLQDGSPPPPPPALLDDDSSATGEVDAGTGSFPGPGQSSADRVASPPPPAPPPAAAVAPPASTAADNEGHEPVSGGSDSEGHEATPAPEVGENGIRRGLFGR